MTSVPMESVEAVRRREPLNLLLERKEDAELLASHLDSHSSCSSLSSVLFDRADGDVVLMPPPKFVPSTPARVLADLQRAGCHARAKAQWGGAAGQRVVEEALRRHSGTRLCDVVRYARSELEAFDSDVLVTYRQRNRRYVDNTVRSCDRRILGALRGDPAFTVGLQWCRRCDGLRTEAQQAEYKLHLEKFAERQLVRNQLVAADLLSEAADMTLILRERLNSNKDEAAKIFDATMNL